MTKTLVSTNPSRGFEVLGEVAVSTAAEVAATVSRARAAQPAWEALGFEGRARVLEKLVQVFKARCEEFVLMTSREMGRPLAGSRATVDYGIKYWEWNIAHAADCLKPEETYRDEKEVAEVFYEPCGVAAAILPWNFPFSNFTWGVSQNLMAGNSVVFKISEEVPLFGKLIDEAFAQAGVPEGVFNQVYGGGEVGAFLLAQKLDLLCFTGSTATGRLIYQAAAAQMIPALLEMGGSDPGIVFADADVPRVVGKIYDSRFRNTGQICNALKRLIVHESRVAEVIEALLALIAKNKVGDPEDPTSTLGPLVSLRQLALLEAQVDDARAKGAKIIVGGKRPEGLEGAFYEQTLITHVTRDMRVWHEELFGPVLPIVTFATFEEALALARDTSYGLGSYIFTEDKALGLKAAQALGAGMAQINSAIAGRPCNPFGGRGLSGLGMENGRYGFHEVCRKKLIAREI